MSEQKWNGTKLECLLNPWVFAAEEGLGRDGRRSSCYTLEKNANLFLPTDGATQVLLIWGLQSLFPGKCPHLDFFHLITLPPISQTRGEVHRFKINTIWLAFSVDFCQALYKAPNMNDRVMHLNYPILTILVLVYRWGHWVWKKWDDLPIPAHTRMEIQIRSNCLYTLYS